MDDTGGGNDLVRGIASEIEPGRGLGNGEINAPDVKAAQYSDHLTVVEVHVEPLELNELGQFPQHDGGNGPRIPGQDGLFGPPEFTVDRQYEDVRVKIEHPRPSEHPY